MSSQREENIWSLRCYQLIKNKELDMVVANLATLELFVGHTIVLNMHAVSLS